VAGSHGSRRCLQHMKGARQHPGIYHVYSAKTLAALNYLTEPLVGLAERVVRRWRPRVFASGLHALASELGS
jgi:hypothetical protein